MCKHLDDLSSRWREKRDVSGLGLGSFGRVLVDQAGCFIQSLELYTTRHGESHL